MAMGKKAVFLDRDGALIVDMDYLSDPDGVQLIDGAAEAVRRLSAAGYLIVMVSNQSGVARGMFTEREVRAVNRRVYSLLEQAGAHLDGDYYCPHYPKGTVPRYSIQCNCRKPAPGMGLRAAAELDIDLGRSCMIGDKSADVEFGKNCGMKNAVLVRTGHGMDQELDGGYGMIAADIRQAAELILQAGEEE